MLKSTNLIFVSISIFGMAVDHIHKGEKMSYKCNAMNRAILFMHFSFSSLREFEH